MKLQLVSTWKMSHKSMEKFWPMMKDGLKPTRQYGSKQGETPLWSQEEEFLADLIQGVIQDVEDDEALHSVGSGGLPGKTGILECDAAYMNGSSNGIGAVMSVRGVKNPILLAGYLSYREKNGILSSRGAEVLAKELGMKEMASLSPEAQRIWEKACNTQKSESVYEEMPLHNHDTVCVLGRYDHHYAVGVSTSGLFMKEEGRVGDSPLVGSGFYAKKGVGSAAATGLGEDIMRGCLSYEIVRLMQEGCSAQRACEKAVLQLENQLHHKETSISVVALGYDGQVGAATTMTMFPFVYADEDSFPTLMCVYRQGDHFYQEKANQKFFDTYMGD